MGWLILLLARCCLEGLGIEVVFCGGSRVLSGMADRRAIRSDV
jgi:hypothetical protein